MNNTNVQHPALPELLQAAIETMAQGVSIVDSSLNLIAWNESYKQIFDYPPDLLYVGCPIEKVYRFNAERGIIETRTATSTAIRKRLALMTSASPYRLTRALPNGSVIEISGNPMPNGGFVTTYIDITEHHNRLTEREAAHRALPQHIETDSQTLRETNARLQRENQLRMNAERRLKETQHSKSQFMSATSHDLLQPINAARLFTATLKALPQLAQDPRLLAIINNIDCSLLNAETLIDELREIAHLDSGRQQATLKHFNSKPLLTQLSTQLRPLAAEKNLTLTCHPSSRWLYSDAHLLRRIVENLLSNAIRYTANGRVVLGCRRHQDGLSIEVWDTGPGIPNSEQQRIFTEFERLQQHCGQHDEGLGLGLTIAQRYAELLDHPLTLRSTPGHGTTFAIRVPYGKEEHDVDRRPATGDQQQQSTVLCINEDSNALTTIRALLEGWGYLVITACGSEEASQRCQTKPPAIMTIDLADVSNSVEVALAIRRENRHAAPVIIISDDDGDAARHQVKTANCYFIAKPLNKGRLKATIRQLITPSA